VIDWDKAKVIDRESDKSGRHIREAIWIRKTDNNKVCYIVYFGCLE